MPFNLQTFKTRALTAIVFVIVMLAGLLWNFWSFLVLFTIIHFGCWMEYLKLAEKIYSTKIERFVKWFFAVGGFIMMIVLGMQNWSINIGKTIAGYDIRFKLLFFAVLFLGLIIFAAQNKMIPAKTKWMIFGGFIYISLSLAALINLYPLIDIHLHDTYIILAAGLLPITIIISIWINDTMAYIVGSFIGKTPFSKISPKKTWEGTIGGIALTVLSVYLLSYFKYAEIVGIAAAIIASLCAIFGTIGDLFESKLKRMAGVKDSGSIMPGHGGFLDRFDSLLFAAPAVWLYVKLFLTN